MTADLLNAVHLQKWIKRRPSPTLLTADSGSFSTWNFCLDNTDGTASQPISGSVLSFRLPEYYEVSSVMTMRTIEGAFYPQCLSIVSKEALQGDPNNRYLVRESEGLSPLPSSHFTIRRWLDKVLRRMLHGGSPRDLWLRPHEFPRTSLHFREGCAGESCSSCRLRRN